MADIILANRVMHFISLHKEYITNKWSIRDISNTYSENYYNYIIRNLKKHDYKRVNKIDNRKRSYLFYISQEKDLKECIEHCNRLIKLNSLKRLKEGKKY